MKAMLDPQIVTKTTPVIAAVFAGAWAFRCILTAFGGGTFPMIGVETEGGFLNGLLWLIVLAPLSVLFVYVLSLRIMVLRNPGGSKKHKERRSDSENEEPIPFKSQFARQPSATKSPPLCETQETEQTFFTSSVAKGNRDESISEATRGAISRTLAEFEIEVDEIEARVSMLVEQLRKQDKQSTP